MEGLKMYSESGICIVRVVSAPALMVSNICQLMLSLLHQEEDLDSLGNQRMYSNKGLKVAVFKKLEFHPI